MFGDDSSILRWFCLNANNVNNICGNPYIAQLIFLSVAHNDHVIMTGLKCNHEGDLFFNHPHFVNFCCVCVTKIRKSVQTS